MLKSFAGSVGDTIQAAGSPTIAPSALASAQSEAMGEYSSLILDAIVRAGAALLCSTRLSKATIEIYKDAKTINEDKNIRKVNEVELKEEVAEADCEP